MSGFRRIVIGTAAMLLATIPAPAAARADDPATPDPTVLDVLDSVLAQTGGPGTVQPPSADPNVPVGPP
jgi:hypothetical protein